MRAIDAGIPQLSMHSIRATTGSLDPGEFCPFELASKPDANGLDRIGREAVYGLLRPL